MLSFPKAKKNVKYKCDSIINQILEEPFLKPHLRLRDSLDCWPLHLKDKHFIAMSLKDRTPCENQKMLNWPRVLNVASTKSIAAKFSPRFPFAS